MEEGVFPAAWGSPSLKHGEVSPRLRGFRFSHNILYIYTRVLLTRVLLITSVRSFIWYSSRWYLLSRSRERPYFPWFSHAAIVLFVFSRGLNKISPRSYLLLLPISARSFTCLPSLQNLMSRSRENIKNLRFLARLWYSLARFPQPPREF